MSDGLSDCMREDEIERLKTEIWTERALNIDAENKISELDNMISRSHKREKKLEDRVKLLEGEIQKFVDNEKDVEYPDDEITAAAQYAFIIKKIEKFKKVLKQQ